MTDRVRETLSWYASGDPGTKADLYRMLDHGRLAGAGKPVMLPVGRGLGRDNREIGRRSDVVDATSRRSRSGGGRWTGGC